MISNLVRLFLHTLAALTMLSFMAAPLSLGERAAGPEGAQSAARLTPEQAIAAAVNDLEATADGYRLRHPRHVATFTPDGLQFRPRRGGPEWAWQLVSVAAGDVPLSGVVEVGAVRPASEPPGVVAYSRGGLVEQYLARQERIEQQFVIPQPLPLSGANLVVAGAVRSGGTFEEAEDGWRWRTPEGAVRLGDVWAYDAAGRDLPATMRVTATATRIVVDGRALARAAYPVTIDPEIGANDFRLSDMGGDVTFDAYWPAVAYNSTEDEYLVVWYGDDNTGPLVDDEYEIFGQRVDAATGAEIGGDLRLSDMGSDGDSHYGAQSPAVAYNSTEDEYLVVWRGDDNTGSLVNNEYEIYGQRVAAATGAEIGANDFRLSDMGPDGNANYAALRPAVAYNSTNNQYLVVWYGDDNTGSLVEDEFEIFGQRVNAATGAEIGANDFRLSDMGPDGNRFFYDARYPAVAYNSTEDEYLVVWQGDDDTGGLVYGEDEIFGQRVNAATGAEIGANDFRLSDMGPDGDSRYNASSPAVAYNSTEDEYLVVWHGDDDTGSLVDYEFEIYGQRVNADGAEIGTNDLRLSDMGPDGDTNYSAWYPAVAYNSTEDEYLVVWWGDDDTAPLLKDEYEIFGQRVDADTGAEIGINDVRLSDMGGDDTFDASTPAVAYNSAGNEYLVVWSGDDNTGGLVDDEREIFGQRVNAATGAEIGTDLRLSDMGPDGDSRYRAYSPAVAYNSTEDEYLVVWRGDDNTAPLVDNEDEIFGQRVNAATGAEIGANDFRLSDMGPDGDSRYGARSPAVAYNSAEDEYLVVWYGDDNTGPLVDDEDEIFGQRVDAATGAEIGTNDFRLSDMGPDGNMNYVALRPAVAYNSMEDEYLVVWDGDDNTAPLVDNEFEIFGQRVDAATGAEIGTDLRLSDMGPDGDVNYRAYLPAVAYNSTEDEYLMVWRGDDDTAPLVDEEFEIYGQRVNAATGAEIGGDLRLSDMGPDGDSRYGAWFPAVAYNSAGNEYLVVWSGDDNTGGLVDEEFEIFGQRVNAATGAEIGGDLRLSDMGPDGNANYGAGSPAVAYNSTEGEYLVVWAGNDNTAPLVDDEVEIYGQRFAVVAGLSITKDDSPDPVDPGATLTYILSVTNAGPDPVSSITVTDFLPSGATFVSASGTGWTCSHAGGVVTCTASGLAVGSAPDIVVIVTAPESGGTITNTATVGSDAPDTSTADNTATATTSVSSGLYLYLPLVLKNR